MAITYATGACWDTDARYPLLCVNVITALRVTWYLSPACSSGFVVVQHWCLQFLTALRPFHPARRSGFSWGCSIFLWTKINSGWGAMRNLDVFSLDLPHHWVMACTTLDVAMGIVNLMPRDKWAGGWKPYTAEKTQQNCR